MFLLLHRATALKAMIFLQVAVISDAASAIQAYAKPSYLTESLIADDAPFSRKVACRPNDACSNISRGSILAGSEKERASLPGTNEASEYLDQRAQGDVPDLLRALRGDEQQTRRNAARALGRLGKAAEHAMPALFVTAGDSRWDVRAVAVWAIGKIARQEPTVDAVSVLTTALDDPADHVRWSAAQSLARIGPTAEAAVPALIKRLEDPVRKVRASAVSALTNVASRNSHDIVLPALARLKDDDVFLRKRAASALRALKSMSDTSSTP